MCLPSLSKYARSLCFLGMLGMLPTIIFSWVSPKVAHFEAELLPKNASKRRRSQWNLWSFNKRGCAKIGMPSFHNPLSAVVVSHHVLIGVLIPNWGIDSLRKKKNLLGSVRTKVHLCHVLKTMVQRYKISCAEQNPGLKKSGLCDKKEQQYSSWHNLFLKCSPLA